jgi:hypothetical protein
MRVLLDENMPQRFRLLLPGHEVFTSKYMAWDGKKNGELLAAMKAQGFQALITYDKALPAQQNLQTTGIGVIVIVRRRSYGVLRTLAPEILRALEFLQPGQVVQVPASSAT